MLGRSETSPTWKNRRLKIEGKKTAGEALNSANRAVKAIVTAVRGQRRSTAPQTEDPLSRKVKDLGKEPLKAVLRIPWWSELGNE